MGRLIDYFNHKYPYSDFHELNADWIISEVKELIEIMDNFLHTETIKFADPITWNITTQYSKNTIVIDSEGNAYLSKEVVPAGIQLNDSLYWLEIFNFTDYTRTANQNLTVNTETNTTRATAAYQVDDWLIWNDVLYKVTSSIAIDDALIVSPDAGANLVHFTVEDFIKAFMTWATNTIQQYKNDVDASELAYRNQLAQDIANTTASLQAQLNVAIAGATVDSEVINARVGWDNTTYNTLGEAIRSQITYLHECVYIEQGGLYVNNRDQSLFDQRTVSTTRVSTNIIKVPNDKSYEITFSGNFDKAGESISIDDIVIFNNTGGWENVNGCFKAILNGGYSYRFVFAKADDSAITPNEVSFSIQIQDNNVFCRTITDEHNILSITDTYPAGYWNDNPIGKPFYTLLKGAYHFFLPIKYPSDGTFLNTYNFNDAEIACSRLTGNGEVVISYMDWVAQEERHYMQCKNDEILILIARNATSYDGIYIKTGNVDNLIDTYNGKLEYPPIFTQGNTYHGESNTLNTRCTSVYWLPLPNNAKYIAFKSDNDKKVRCSFISDRDDPTNTWYDTPMENAWHNDHIVCGVPYGAKFCKFSIAYIDDSVITPSDCNAEIYAFIDLPKWSKKISILGDSITTYSQENAPSAGDGHTIADGTWTFAGNHCRYPQNNLLENPHLTFWVNAIDVLGLTLGINDSWANSRVSWDGVTEDDDHGADIYIGSPTRIGHLALNGTPDIILVHGGTNDILDNVPIGTFNTEDPRNYTDAQIAALDVSTFANAYRAMIIRLQKAYPDSTIIVMLPDFTNYHTAADGDTYNDMIITICNYFGIQYIDNRKCGINMYNISTMFGDNVHPNAKGMYLLSQALIAAMKYKITP